MTTLAKDKVRAFAVKPRVPGKIPAVASDIIYEGAAVGDNGSGYGRPFVAADPFLGFAVENCDNSAGAAGAKDIPLIEEGEVELSVTGVTGVGDVGDTVYATDDDTFTKTSSGGTAIGKIVRYISGTKCIVFFQGAQRRSI